MKPDGGVSSRLWTWGCWLAWLSLPAFMVQAQPPPPDPPPSLARPPSVDRGPVLGSPPPVSPPAATPVQPANNSQRAEVPMIVIEKIGPPTINIGRPLILELVVKNLGSVPVYQVKVEDEVPAKTRFLRAEPPLEVKANRLAWSFDILEPGTDRRLKMEVQPLEETEITSKAVVTFATAVSLSTRVTRPQLMVKKTGPEVVTLGDTVTFRIDVTNPGTGPATGVVVRDQLPPGLQHAQGSLIEAEIGTLAAGETRTLNLNTKAVSPGQHLNEAVATADDDLRATARAVVNVGQPILKVQKSGPAQSFLARETAFTLEVTNPGNAPARQVELLDALPGGLTYVTASEGGRYDKSSHSVSWDLGTVQPGETRRVSLRVLPIVIGEMRNQAVVRGEPSLLDKVEQPLQVVGIPALLLEVVDLDDPLEVGAETRYEIRVLNQGSAVSTNVQVMAMLPDGLMPVRAEAEVGHRIQGRQVIFDPLPRLASKADMVFHVTVRAVAPGDHRFKVQLNSDQLRIPVYEEESTRVYREQ